MQSLHLHMSVHGSLFVKQEQLPFMHLLVLQAHLTSSSRLYGAAALVFQTTLITSCLTDQPYPSEDGAAMVC